MRSSQEVLSRQRKIGIAIVSIAVVVAVSLLWSWMNLRERLYPVDIYFPYSVHGLTRGADVVAAGEKIGKVEKIRIARISDNDGGEKFFAVVTALTDRHRAKNRIALSEGKEDFQRALSEQIELGLRARLILPSILSNGLVLEFYFDKGSAAYFAHDPEAENPEIPIAKIDEEPIADILNKKLDDSGAEEFPAKIKSFQRDMENISEMFGAIDMEKVNATAVSGTKRLAEIFDAEEFGRELRELNANLGKLSEKIENGDENFDDVLADTLASLKAISARLNAAASEMQAMTDAMKFSYPEVNQALHEWQDKLEGISRDLREFMN